jgi:transposase-like protein
MVTGQSRVRANVVVERRLILEDAGGGSSVARVALKHGVNANQLFKWRLLAVLERERRVKYSF